MRSTVKIVITLMILSAAFPAAARAHHAARHHPGRHVPAHHGARGQPPLIPGAHPGYRYGGPLYSTCDRINADRMLVGTCR